MSKIDLHTMLAVPGRKGERLDQKGFTLIEIIAVLVMLSVLAAIAVPRYINLEANAKQRAVDEAIAELSQRESLTWADQKISSSGFISDHKTFNHMQTNLGSDYVWTAGPTDGTGGGGTLQFQGGTPVPLERVPGNSSQPATWRRK